MKDDELLAIYGGIRKLAASMEERNAALVQSTAALNASIAQVEQLPAILGRQSAQHIVLGVKEAITDNFDWPIQESIREPLERLHAAASSARTSLADIKHETRFHTLSYLAVVLALGFGLGSFGTYFFFTRQIQALNERFDSLQQLLVTPPAAQAAAPAQVPPPKKKHGPH